MIFRFIGGLIFALILLVPANSASAQYVYTAANPSRQTPDAGFENFNYYWWAIVPSYMGWYAAPNLRLNAITAMQRWNAWFPYLTWLEEPNQSLSDLEFLDYMPTECANLAGCRIVTQLGADSTRDANYVVHMRIHMNPALTGTTNDQSIGGIVHELGHVVGLDDQYVFGCNDSVISVMDASKLTSPTTYDMCDSTSPTAADIDRLRSYWERGTIWNVSMTTDLLFPTILVVHFEDVGWAESRQRIYYFWWNGSAWVDGGFDNVYSNIGVHRETQVRSFAYGYDRVARGMPAGEYIACGHGFHEKYGGYGNFMCSTNTVILS